MDMEKEGLGAAADEAIANAATANVNAAIEVASSAVTAFVDSLAGRKKHEEERNAAQKQELPPYPNGEWRRLHLRSGPPLCPRGQQSNLRVRVVAPSEKRQSKLARALPHG